MKKLLLTFMTLGLSALLASCRPPSSPEPATATSIPSAAPPSATAAPPSPTPPPATDTPEPTPTPPAIVLPSPPPTSSAPPLARLAADTPIEVREIHMIDETTGWALGGLVGGDDHVLITHDAGRTWRDVTPPQPGLEDGAPIAAEGFFASALEAWVVFYDSFQPPLLPVQALVVWHTPDAGQTWTHSDPVGLEFIGVKFLPPILSFPDPRQGWLLANAGAAGMHRYPVYLLQTTDGGTTWTPLIDPYQGPYLQSCLKSGIAFNRAGVGIATIGSCPMDGGIFAVSPDGGATWETRTLPSPPGGPDIVNSTECDVHAPAFLTDAHVVLAAECHTFVGDNVEEVPLVFTSGDSGATWESRSYPGGDVFFLDEQVGWALGRDIYNTADGGDTWTFVKSVAWDGQFSFVDAQMGWAVARADDEIALVKTEDGGSTWAQLHPIVGP